MSYHDRAVEVVRMRTEAGAARVTFSPSPEEIAFNEARQEFNALNIPELLEEINRDVWGGRGRIEIADDGRTIALSAQAPKVGMEWDPHLSRWQFEVDHYGDRGSVIHRKQIGRRVTGYGIKQIPHFIKFTAPGIDYRSFFNKRVFSLRVENSHPIDKKTFVKSLEIKTAYEPIGASTEPVRMLIDSIAEILVTDKFDYREVTLFYPQVDTTRETMVRRFVDGVLLASCVSRTHNPIEAAEQEAEAEIARIKPLIGTVIPNEWWW